MSAGYAVALRNAQMDAITTFAGNGAKLRIYGGTRPATGGTVTTLLAELTCGSPFAGAASGGVLTANAVTQDSGADASGTATWFRIVKADGTTHVMDGTATATGGGGELELTTTAIVATQPVSVSSLTITRGNA